MNFDLLILVCFQALFSDFGGYLVMNEASLGALNDRLQNKVTFRTFRPNIVISGCDAFAEVLLSNYHNYGILCDSTGV